MKRKKERIMKCPFCGRTPTINKWEELYRSGITVSCDNDHCLVAPQVSGEDSKEIISIWNKRYQ